MGTDLYGWIEIADWKATEMYKAKWRGVMDLCAFMSRDYSVQFFFCDDHKGYELWPEADMNWPTITNRGRPDDMSADVTTVLEDDLFDGYGINHIYYHELEDNLLKHGWEQTLKRMNMNDDHFNFTNRMIISESGGRLTREEYIKSLDDKKEYDYAVTPGYEVILSALKIYGEYMPHENIRLVLWEQP